MCVQQVRAYHAYTCINYSNMELSSEADVKAELERLSLKYHIASSAASFVAVQRRNGEVTVCCCVFMRSPASCQLPFSLLALRLSLLTSFNDSSSPGTSRNAQTNCSSTLTGLA